ncbi:hypothetical protein [Mangrovibacterium marinum]|uniref:Outer membrane protein with beta-barrel domain n=1 Tax=Mangrovibacterium marinum TaxID=1639118 RepID=A0A2T5BXH6_9BACT|nr:hypothetical protein [Mangrovibacterium marinum]PTN05308.1 hypothetical protein C8N47_12730 [Mangrovibacterium marinum]
MKRLKHLLQTGFLLVVSINALAQPTNKDWMLSGAGNYYKKTTSESVSGSSVDQMDKSIIGSFMVERFLSDRFSVGIGIARHWEDGELDISNFSNNTLTRSVMELESNYWMPQLFGKYYLPLKGRLYLVPRFTASYGKAKAEGFLLELSAQYIESDEIQMGQAGQTTATESYFRTDVDLFSAELAPDLVFFFAQRWGVSVSPGGLRYDKVSGDLDDSEWTFSFKRQYWRLGVNFRF